MKTGKRKATAVRARAKARANVFPMKTTEAVGDVGKTATKMSVTLHNVPAAGPDEAIKADVGENPALHTAITARSVAKTDECRGIFGIWGIRAGNALL
jgi:hypothetical protein